MLFGWVGMHAGMTFTCSECESFLGAVLLGEFYVVDVTELVPPPTF